MIYVTFFKTIATAKAAILRTFAIDNFNLETTTMSKEKEGKGKSDKTAPVKNLKEKRAAKAAKREDKKRQD